MIGASLGPYTILESLGAGGMGEVFLAEDTSLGRKVAIKVLPEEIAVDPERLARFEQEARASAALSHPHIAAVFDVGEAERQDVSGATLRTQFMVQEYLEGHTLRTTLAPGALSLSQALNLGSEMAQAIAAAHAVGIIHRDLKPENIFVTKEGHAKVLDFGLAKLTESSPVSGGDAAESPTRLGTVVGQVMGSAGYMAPEQARGGEEIDARADVFSFGCVLYEMVSGRRAFSGETLLDTLHAIARSDPAPLEEIVPEAPAELCRIVSKCLAKDPMRRYQHADDLAVDLRTLATEGESRVVSPSAATAGQRAVSFPTIGGIAIGGVAVGAILMYAFLPAGEPSQQVSRVAIELDESQVLDSTGMNPFAISPDGRLIVYAAEIDGESHLFLRRIDDFETERISDTEGASGPFFSPDGEWIGFFTPGQIRKVGLRGGQSQLIAEAGWTAREAAWGADDTIVIGTASPDGLYRVSAAGGGALEVLVPLEPGDASLERPVFLPDGRTFLYVAELSARAEVRAYSLDSGPIGTLATGTAARYVPSGHLVYAESEGNLMVAPFDIDAVEITDSPVSLETRVRVHASGAAYLDVSAAGSLVYVPSGSEGNHSLLWVDREGNTTPVTGEKMAYSNPSVAPDGRRVSVEVGAATTDTQVWTLDLERDILTPLTSQGTNLASIWSPDGEWVYFSSTREESQGWDIFRKPANAGQRDPAEPILARAGFQIATDISADGETLVVTDGGPQGNLMLVRVDGTSSAVQVESSGAAQGMGTFSPDGRWLAFVSDETGRREVYIRPASAMGSAVQISRDGGSSPVWAKDGSELFYRRGAEVIDVELEFAPELRPVTEQPLFEMNDVRTVTTEYDVGLDGRFLMVVDEQSTRTASFNLVLNWAEELRGMGWLTGR